MINFLANEMTLLEKYQMIQELCKELEVKMVHTSCNIILEDDRGGYESFDDLSKIASTVFDSKKQSTKGKAISLDSSTGVTSNWLSDVTNVWEEFTAYSLFGFKKRL